MSTEGESPRPSLPQDLAAAASWYAAHGTRVFPLYGVHEGVCDCGNPECSNQGKHPRTEHGFKDASSDPLEVADWWDQWPTANIGMPTGPYQGAGGVFVVDVDPRHEGMTTIQQLMDDHGGLPLTPEVHTGGGGQHLYFRCPNPPLLNSANGLGPGVDTRGLGGYVILPPSTHKSGGTYQWTREPSEVPAPAVPPWMIETLGRNNGHGEHGADGAPARKRLDWDNVFDGVPEGQRDATLFHMASSLRRKPEMSQRLAEEMLLVSARNCTPPFPDEEVRKKVAWVWHQYEPSLPDLEQGETVTIQDLPDDGIAVVTTTPLGPLEWVFESLEQGHHALDGEMTLRFLMPGTSQGEYCSRINLMSSSARESCRRELEAVYGKGTMPWAKLIADTFVRVRKHHVGKDRSIRASDIAQPNGVEMLVSGFMPAEGTTILFGAGSGTKTFLALLLSICISKGIPFLGRPCEQQNVLFIDYETQQRNWSGRLGRLLRGLGYARNAADEIQYWDPRGIPLFDIAESIKQHAQRLGCGVVVIDHAALACGGEAEKSDAALLVKRALSRIGLPCLLVAHITGDGETNPSYVQRPFGSVFWSNLARRTWYLHRVQDQDTDVIEAGLYCRKNNDGKKPPDFGIQIRFEDPDGAITIGPADLRTNPRLTQNQRPEEQIWQALDEPLTPEDIADATGLKLSTVKHTLREHPKRFVNQGPGEGTAGRGQRGQWARLGLL